MQNSKIEWTDHTFNPWIGCTRVSPGCVNCYAETMMADRYKKVKWGPTGERKRTSADYWKQPLKWNREAAAAGERRRVFCASLADVFEYKKDQVDDLRFWRFHLWELIDETPHLDWLLLTKRPENVNDIVPFTYGGEWPSNIWIGTSVETQEYADKRIPELLKIPAAMRFLSVEPLLGPVDLHSSWGIGGQFCHKCGGFGWYDEDGNVCPRCLQTSWTTHAHIDWVIVGGESGPNARPMHPDWVRSIRDQCQAAGVPFLFKQWGEWTPDVPPLDLGRRKMTYQHACSFYKVGKHNAGRLLDGREWNEFPQSPTGETP